MQKVRFCYIFKFN